MTARETLAEYLARRSDEVNVWLDLLLPPADAYPTSIHRAMRYSLLGGGKRLRPILVLTAGETLGAATESLMRAACAIEMIHTYSLIHDDLPAMDNDDLRRGRPTCHKQFSEAIGILAGDALLTHAFVVLAAADSAGETGRQIRVIREIAAAAGSIDALIGGQVVDIESESTTVDADTVDYIHRSKTGAMIRVSLTTGAILAGATDDQIQRLGDYGDCIGLAFQIADDLLDVTASSAALGKTAGKDLAAKKATYPALHGIVASEVKARQLVERAVELVRELPVDTSRLQEIARFIVARSS